MINFTEEEFNNLRIKFEEEYKKTESVYCPYFGEKVVFNSKGLEHLKFKSKHKARTREDQFIRFKIFKYVKNILENSKTIQGISEEKIFEEINSNHRTYRELVTANFYEFIAVIDNTRIRVILKEVNGSDKYFWSVIPFWGKGKNNKRKLHYGRPNFD